jgi:hypothetical protein
MHKIMKNAIVEQMLNKKVRDHRLFLLLKCAKLTNHIP